MKPALVYGADEFFGLSFCEHLLEEGVNIDVKLEQTSDEKKLMYLEERLMWLGRNRNFRLIEKELESSYEQVFIQYTGSVPEEALAAGNENKPVILFVYQDQFEEDLRASMEEKGVELIVLPELFGPWDIKAEDKQNRDGALFVNDAAAQAAACAVQKDFSALQFVKKTSYEKADEIIEEWSRQMSTFFDKK
ncbi:hypothetical protein MOC74_13480 [Bacillus haynesii]|uniref:hypothetical protein n=1 Tax=Bacillus haynesii TaxID=1925021 RepID=UPI00227FD262|nr:hypothetical protein [Bacillus haynesii]MCY8044953.1 hypothetical protein [Bacillus haynesii]MCY8078314.1 hypothetical protein [Bacillus haynesii]MCY8346457.1 hypothetical protein [Bacillus haynesii]MCY8557646.1 hypothetical protein [Bacillus haynesii]MCY9263279.1 hypothetical protein [Bacillus haynesii]